MKRFMVAMMLMGAALVLASGVAWALTVDCQVGVDCEGTDEPDELIGTNTPDFMNGKQDDDLLVGFMRADEMYGDNPQPGGDDTTDGDDELIGYRGRDTLFGFGGSDYLRGGLGDDHIDATEESDNPGEDTVRGSRGQDFIDAVDGFKDTIFCGRGDADEVFFDEGLDVVADNCELQNPRSR